MSRQVKYPCSDCGWDGDSANYRDSTACRACHRQIKTRQHQKKYRLAHYDKVSLKNRSYFKTPAGKEVNRRSNQKYFSKTTHAYHHYRRWTKEEIMLIYDTRYTDHELNVMLGRSVGAIENARARHKELAPLGWKPKGTILKLKKKTTAS